MRVAMLVGLLIFNVMAGIYRNALSENANGDAGLFETQEVQALDGDNQPPPSWP